MELEIGRFISVIGQSVSDAQKALSYNAIQAYLDYFHKPVDGEAVGLTPDTAELLIPMPDAEAPKKVVVPLVALSRHSSLELENIKMKLRVLARTDEQGDVMVDLHAPDGNGNAGETECLTELELTFQRQAPAEGVARLVTEVNKFL